MPLAESLLPEFDHPMAARPGAADESSLTEKIAGELESVSAQSAREMDLWAKERLYDLRVFASSYEVSENLERIPRVGGKLSRRPPPRRPAAASTRAPGR